MGFFSSIGNAIGKVVGGITGASQQADAARDAANTQAAAADAGVAENRRQFDATRDDLMPFLRQAQQAIGLMGNFTGLGGADAQQSALQGLQNDPTFHALSQQGEDAILANASATGGLRGGNTQAALEQFRPQLLNQLLNERFAQLGGIAGMGSGVGVNLGALGASSAGNISNLLQQRGAALAGGQMAQGGVTRQAFGDLTNLAALAIGAKKAGMF